MDLMKLQNLLNECIMIEQGNYLGGNFSVNLAEAQAELDQAKQLLIHVVVGQSEQLCEGLHSTDFNGKCFKCGEQVFVREPK
jgi:hypothetical protein